MNFRYFQYIGMIVFVLAGTMCASAQTDSSNDIWTIYQGKYGMSVHINEDMPTAKEWISFSCNFPEKQDVTDATVDSGKTEASSVMDTSVNISIVLKDSLFERTLQKDSVTVWFESGKGKFKVDMKLSDSSKKKLEGDVDLSEEFLETLMDKKTLKVRVDGTSTAISLPVNGLEKGIQIMVEQCWPGAG